MTEKKVKFTTDDIFLEVGEFGKYQFLVFCLIGLTSTMNAFGAFQTVFTDATPKHRCKIPFIQNDTYEIFSEEQERLVNYYIPNTNDGSYDTCNIRINEFDNTTRECTEWVYSKEFYDYTVITQYDFVCSNLSDKSLYQSLFFAGTFGVILIGILGDRFGRKIITYLFVMLCSLIFVISSLSVNLIKNDQASKGMLGFTRFGIGFTSAVYAIACVLAVEIVGPSYRVMANNVMYYFFILGELIVLFFAYFVRDYRYFTICMTALVTLIVTYFWWVPESTRYLINRKRYDEADAIFRRIAKSNKKQYTYSAKDLAVDEDVSEKQEKVGFKALLTNKTIVIRMLVSLLQWFTNSFVYYGISLNTGVLGGDPYLNFLYSTIVEFFGVFACQFVLNRFGRKIPYVANFFVIAVSLIAIGFVPSDITWLIIILVLIAKFSISFNFNAIYIVTAESYPTVIRNTALSTCSVAARIASTISPYVGLLRDLVWGPLPFVLYGALAGIAGILFYIVMPETNNVPLPETLEDLYDKKKVKPTEKMEPAEMKY